MSEDTIVKRITGEQKEKQKAPEPAKYFIHATTRTEHSCLAKFDAGLMEIGDACIVPHEGDAFLAYALLISPHLSVCVSKELGKDIAETIAHNASVAANNAPCTCENHTGFKIVEAD